MMQSSFQPQRLDKNITKEEYLSKNVERNWQSKNVERDWESKNVDRDWESKKVERDWESKNVDRDWESKKKDKDVKPEKLDPIISREEYLDKNRVLPADRFADRFEDRFQTEKKPSTIHAKPSYSGVSGGAIIAEKGSEFIRPLNQHLVNHAAYNQPPYYEGERFSEPWGRSSIPMTYSKPMRYTGHEDPTFIDKSWSRQDRYYPGSNMPSRETSKLKGKEQREYIAERKNLATGYSSFSTPSKPNKEITKREYPDDREYFNPTILRPSTYRSGIKPSDMVVGAASDLFTSMGMKPKPVEYSPHESFINDPSEIVEALIKVQRVNPLTGKAESFHEEGLTTTLRIHRRMLKDHGLKKDDEGILEFMKRKHFDLDKIIDFNTRNSLKRAIGLGPLDNIKLELLPSSFTTSYPQTQVGQIFRRPIDQNRSFNDYSSWERERVPIGRSAFVGGPMIERRSYESPEGYYGRGDQWETEGVEHKRPGVFKRTFEGIKSTIRPHKEQDIEGEYAETGYERRPYEFRDQNYGRRADWQETEDVSPKKPSKMKEAIEGIKCTIQGPKYHLKHPEINPSTDEPVMEKWGGERWGQRGPISQNPVSFEERGYGYKSERPIYSSKQELGYERNRSVVGQGDFYDKGFVERPNYYDRGISQRTEEPYYRY